MYVLGGTCGKEFRIQGGSFRDWSSGLRPWSLAVGCRGGGFFWMGLVAWSRTFERLKKEEQSPKMIGIDRLEKECMRTFGPFSLSLNPKPLTVHGSRTRDHVVPHDHILPQLCASSPA